MYLTANTEEKKHGLRLLTCKLGYITGGIFKGERQEFSEA